MNESEGEGKVRLTEEVKERAGANINGIGKGKFQEQARLLT